MLVLTRKTNESLVVGDSIVVTVVRITPYAVRIGIEAPGNVTVSRPERQEIELPLNSINPEGDEDVPQQ